MRRRIVTVALAAVALAVTVFGVPLAILVQRMVLSDEQGELERLALRAAVDVGPTFASGDPIELPSTEPAVQLAVDDTAGTRITGRGPAQLDQPLRDALSGVPVDSRNGLLAAAVPVNSGEQVIAVVRASSPSSVVQHRVWWLWVGMAGIATIAAASAFLLARRLSTVLVRPLIELERVSTELGEGNLGARAGPSGVAGDRSRRRRVEPYGRSAVCADRSATVVHGRRISSVAYAAHQTATRAREGSRGRAR